MLFEFSPKPALMTFVIVWNLFFPNLVLANNTLGSANSGPTSAPAGTKSVRFPAVPKADPNFFYNSSVEQILGKMSIDEKIGQLLLIGFPQDKMDTKLSRHINQNKTGSFLIFKKNIVSLQQLKSLNANLVSQSMDSINIPPLLAIDQEGGNVTRIATNPKFPFLFHFGDFTDSKFSYQYGYYTGQILSSLGFNFNLAPVLDLADFNSNRFIALRSFGSDPQRTSQNGYAYSQGLLNQ